MNDSLLVLDFGGQYKELIARTIRKLSVYSEIRPGNMSVETIKQMSPTGIILTGGPGSVYLDNAPKCDPKIFDLGIPVLGICYGMQLMCHMLGGKIRLCNHGEYGMVDADLDNQSVLFDQVSRRSKVLMSHADMVSELPKGFKNIGTTAQCIHAACENFEKKLYAVQFHPETSENRQDIFKNFLFKICGATGKYKLGDYMKSKIYDIRKKVGDKKVLLALSGGVDSSVCAALLSEAVPGQLSCVFVDHGFMRQGEGDYIEQVFSKRKINFIRVNAQKRFLAKIKGVTDPEQKRKIIGGEFAQVFEQQARQLGNIPFLAQGTIYPDVIESGGELGAVIKSHHNVGGLPDDLSFIDVIEPLSGLFKDEVRELGKKLGLPLYLVNRQPFPGPGLAIRIMGEVTEQKLDILRQADFIFCDEISKLRKKPHQYFAVFTDIRSVGVKGDSRIYDYVIALRAVTTDDFMTCEYANVSYKTLSRVSRRITGSIKQVSRVVFDVTSKPPATVEWE